MGHRTGVNLAKACFLRGAELNRLPADLHSQRLLRRWHGCGQDYHSGILAGNKRGQNLVTKEGPSLTGAR